MSWQTLVRSTLLCAGAITAIGLPPLQLPASGRQAAAVLVVLAAELLVLASLSPEIGEIMVKLGYSEPCEVRRLPVSRTLAALRASTHWRRYKRYLISPDDPPKDVWREGCWRFVVFQGMLASRRVEVVFAVYLKSRRVPVRAGIYDPTADRRSRAGADGVPHGIDIIPAPRRVPAPSAPGDSGDSGAPGGSGGSGGPVRPVPVVLAATAPRGAPHRMPHHVAHQARHHRHRHSADL